MIAGDYYAEDGEYLGSDENVKDTNIYILKNKKDKREPNSAIATLPNLSMRKAIVNMADRTGKPTSYKDKNRKDPYGNFHEEAVVGGTGSDGKEQIIDIAPGDVTPPAVGGTATADTQIAANPTDQKALDDLWANNKVAVLAHSHHEGGEFPPRKNGQITPNPSVIVGQPPSQVDIEGASDSRMNIVVSTRKNTVYFYNSKGIKAEFSWKAFKKLSK
jgi:hypothetical protein